jgi:hypothetical protein
METPACGGHSGAAPLPGVNTRGVANNCPSMDHGGHTSPRTFRGARAMPARFIGLRTAVSGQSGQESSRAPARSSRDRRTPGLRRPLPRRLDPNFGQEAICEASAILTIGWTMPTPLLRRWPDFDMGEDQPPPGIHHTHHSADADGEQGAGAHVRRHQGVHEVRAAGLPAGPVQDHRRAERRLVIDLRRLGLRRWLAQRPRLPR